MKKIALSLGSCLLLCAGLAAANSVGDDAKASPLDPFKSLAGDWVMIDEEGNVTDQVVSSYRVTAGGSAVLETLFGGTENEMLTVYHMDGDALVLTHYCMLGNAPSMRAKQSESANHIVFECQGGANIPNENAAHMHHAEMNILENGRIKAAWAMFENGKSEHEVTFHLQRKE